MKLSKLLSTTFAAAALACAADAQQLFGPWVHDASLPFSLFVDDQFGSDANTGFDPANAFKTLEFAVQQADFWQSVLYPITPDAMTINVLPGNYVLTESLKLPAFGLSIEPYRTATPGTVTISGSFSNDGLLDFDRLVGTQTEAAIGLPDDLPPSIVRGLTITGNSSGFGVEIDPSQSASADLKYRTIEVQVNQCTITQCSRGILIKNDNALELEYRNVIVDNQIGSCAVGTEVRNRWWESDLFRSNRIIGSTFEGMRFSGGDGEAGMLHPRILSNTVHVSLGRMNVSLSDCSARIVNNTLAFAGGAGGLATTPATIEIFADAGGSAAETIVIANNILFSPIYLVAGLPVDPPEIRFSGAAPFAGALTVLSNDFDSAGLFSPPAAPPATNVAIANPLFVAAPGNLHLTDASPSTVNAGNTAFVFPGATATITLNGQSVPANCALDVDLDPRTHMRSSDLTEVLHRGSDQHIETLARLRTATSAVNPLHVADAFGNVKTDASGNATVELLLDLPVGSVFAIVLGAALPMGPELEHLAASPFGSLAVDPTPGNGTTLSAVVTTQNPEPFSFNLGQVSPAFTEAEMYLQALIALPNGVITFTNRVRIDVDGI